MGRAVAAEPLMVPAGDIRLAGDMSVPQAATGLVVFAHGSGSGRFSPRNRAVADVMIEAGLATLLMDLLTPEEEAEDLRSARLRFDVQLLGDRVISTVDWLESEPDFGQLPLGCFGASTGAAAALIAAAERRGRLAAIVCRGGRPDLAAHALPRVSAPTLLLVGGLDTEVIRLNRSAQERLACESRLVIVPGAGHLFEEPGALETVAALARDWFLAHL